jgi:hypothetical protein
VTVISPAESRRPSRGKRGEFVGARGGYDVGWEFGWREYSAPPSRARSLASTTGSPGDALIELPLPGPFRLRAFRNSEATVDEDFQIWITTTSGG